MKGVSFGSIHSYEDLNLILEPFTPTPAEPQTNFLQVPGRDGYLDLTEANGEIKYKSREFLIPFTIMPGDDLTFDERVSKVSSILNGVRCKITFDRDPSYYWFGRCSVDKYAQNKNIGQVVIKATVNPYKLKQRVTTKTVNRFYNNKATVILVNGRMPSVPTIECAGDVFNVEFDGEKYPLMQGTNIIPAIRFTEGEHDLYFSGESGSVTITWQEGAL